MKTALLVIDVQQSFQQRHYWREDDVRPFMSRVQQLIDLRGSGGSPVLQVFHAEEKEGPTGPFSAHSGYVKTLAALRIAPTEVFHKSVHSGSMGVPRMAERWRPGCGTTVSDTLSSPAFARSNAARPPPGMPRTRGSR